MFLLSTSLKPTGKSPSKSPTISPEKPTDNSDLLYLIIGEKGNKWTLYPHEASRFASHQSAQDYLNSLPAWRICNECFEIVFYDEGKVD